MSYDEQRISDQIDGGLHKMKEMEKQQTAVQWLIKELRKPQSDKYIVEITKQALQMEREQIEEAYEEGEISFHKSGKDDGQYSKTPQQYYTQTFKP